MMIKWVYWLHVFFISENNILIIKPIPSTIFGEHFQWRVQITVNNAVWKQRICAELEHSLIYQHRFCPYGLVWFTSCYLVHFLQFIQKFIPKPNMAAQTCNHNTCVQRLTQRDCCELEDNLGCIVTTKSTRAMQKDPASKNQKIKNSNFH